MMKPSIPLRRLLWYFGGQKAQSWAAFTLFSYIFLFLLLEINGVDLRGPLGSGVAVFLGGNGHFDQVDPFLLNIFSCGSALACFLWPIDKYISKRKDITRVPERVLFLVSVFGGAAIALIAMFLLRHKTRQLRFYWNIPLTILWGWLLGFYL
jgi:uncharacterized membrane protein YsdA (DUF1294 family)